MSLFAERWVQVRNKTDGAHEFLLATAITRVSVWPSIVADANLYTKWKLKELDFIVLVHRGDESLLYEIAESESDALNAAQKLTAKIDAAAR